MNKKKLTVVLAGGSAALALVGVGAGASFTSTAAAAQHIASGTLHLQASGDGTHFGDSINLPNWGNIGSNATQDETITIKNVGSMPAHLVNVALTDSGTLPIMVTSPKLGINTPVALSSLAKSYNVNLGTLAPGDSFTIPFTLSTGDLPNSDQGQVNDYSFTIEGTE